jgi:tripartite ATP-independent transporter DctP family solute receptor
MKNKVFGVLVLAFMLILSACGGSESSSSSDSSSGEKVGIRLGSHLAPDHSVVKTAEKFKELVSEKSDGRIQVTIHPSGELGDQKELVENLQLGAIEMTVNDAGLLANFVPEVGILDMPYLFKDYDHVHKTFDSEVGTALQEKMAEKGIRSLAWFDSAFRSTFLTEKAESIEDLNGLKIRTPEAPSVIETVKSWDAVATPLPWGELYTAMETGVVDGFEGSAESIYSAKMYEVSKYLVKTEHIFTALSLNISDSFFKGLSEEDQKLISEAALEAGEFGRQLAMDLDQEYFDKLVEEGIEVVEVDKSPFVEKSKAIVEAYAEEVNATDLVNKIRELE